MLSTHGNGDDKVLVSLFPSCFLEKINQVAGSLAAKLVDTLGLAMLAISDQRVDVSIGDVAVRALLVGEGGTLGVHTLGTPRRLFISRHRPTGARACHTTDEGVETRRQAGQSSGIQCLRRRWNLLCLAS